MIWIDTFIVWTEIGQSVKVRKHAAHINLLTMKRNEITIIYGILFAKWIHYRSTIDFVGRHPTILLNLI